MCTYHLSTRFCAPGQTGRRYDRLLNLLKGLMLAALLVSTPILGSTASANSNQGTTQGAAAMAACYGVYHIIRPGQTLYSIAAAYGTTAYRIAMCNGLSSYTIYVGQTLLIPTYRTR